MTTMTSTRRRKLLGSLAALGLLPLLPMTAAMRPTGAAGGLPAAEARSLNFQLLFAGCDQQAETRLDTTVAADSDRSLST